MTNFHKTRFMAPPTFFFIKSGTVSYGYRLDFRGIRGQLKPKTKIGVISKKKKKGHGLSVPRFVPISSPHMEKFCNQVIVDLFFFFF